MIDFKKRLNQKVVESKIHPVEIYDTLDRKSVAGPLRIAQKNILNEWFDKYRDNKDLIIKLHTGEGKTLIGLLILQSNINAGNGPCIYVCADRYLVEQVCTEAQKFGVQFCRLLSEHDLPNDFLRGKKILITHAQKIFNGLSIFGLGNNAKEVNTIILDDAHACINMIKKSYTIHINKL